MNRLLALGLCSLLISSVQAQQLMRGTPPSWNAQTQTLLRAQRDEVPTRALSPLSVAELEAKYPYTQGRAPMYGEPRELVADLQTAGSWTTLPDGMRLWRLRVASPGAKHLSLSFRRFELPKGAALYLYNDDHTSMVGALSAINNDPNGLFTLPVWGDVVTIEYAVPAFAPAVGALELERVVHGFRDVGMGPRQLLDEGASGTCNVDVVCALTATYDGGVQRRSVGKILSENGSHCTGAMINNTAQDGRALFLTADHCLREAPTFPVSRYIVVFNYERPNCGSGAPAIEYQAIAGSTSLARNEGFAHQDFMLLELSSRPPVTYNTFYAGWNRTLTAPSATFGIHHPCGDVKKFSYDANAPVAVDLQSGFVEAVGSNFWRINWDGGTVTEPASSGSPLFDPQGRIIGQLFGGASQCANWLCGSNGSPAISTPDWYGRIGAAWTGAGASNSRLRDHLDPLNTDVQTLNGAESSSFAGQPMSGYCFSGAEKSEDSRIDRVQWGSSQIPAGAPSGACARYTDQTSNMLTAQAGMTYPLQVTKGTCGGDFTYVARVFIDWNADRDFDDPGERVLSQRQDGSTALSSAMITVPASVVNGTQARMRVVIREAITAFDGGAGAPNAEANTTPCGIYPWGETEDFTLNLVNLATSVEDAGQGASDRALEVYPNPAEGPVTVRWALSQSDEPALLAVVDASGATALAAGMSYVESEGAYRATLAPGSLAPGSYVVRVARGDRVAAKRLVVVR